MWDYVCGFDAWGLFHDDAIVVPAYTPSSDDLQFGLLLRSTWLDIMVNGSTSLLTPVLAHNITDTDYTVNLVTSHGALPTINYNAERCLALQSSPLFLDQRFWLTN